MVKAHPLLCILGKAETCVAAVRSDAFFGAQLRLRTFLFGVTAMELHYFKDILFDLINESDLPIADIRTVDRENLLCLEMEDGTVFHLRCEKV